MTQTGTVFSDIGYLKHELPRQSSACCIQPIPARAYLCRQNSPTLKNMTVHETFHSCGGGAEY